MSSYTLEQTVTVASHSVVSTSLVINWHCSCQHWSADNVLSVVCIGLHDIDVTCSYSFLDWSQDVVDLYSAICSERFCF